MFKNIFIDENGMLKKKVKFRSGGEAIITGFSIVAFAENTDVKLKFNKGSTEVVYTADGLARKLPAVFDIVEAYND